MSGFLQNSGAFLKHLWSNSSRTEPASKYPLNRGRHLEKMFTQCSRVFFTPLISGLKRELYYSRFFIQSTTSLQCTSIFRVYFYETFGHFERSSASDTTKKAPLSLCPYASQTQHLFYYKAFSMKAVVFQFIDNTHYWHLEYIKVQGSNIHLVLVRYLPNILERPKLYNIFLVSQFITSIYYATLFTCHRQFTIIQFYFPESLKWNLTNAQNETQEQKKSKGSIHHEILISSPQKIQFSTFIVSMFCSSCVALQLDDKSFLRTEDIHMEKLYRHPFRFKPKTCSCYIHCVAAYGS